MYAIDVSIALMYEDRSPSGRRLRRFRAMCISEAVTHRSNVLRSLSCNSAQGLIEPWLPNYSFARPSSALFAAMRVCSGDQLQSTALSETVLSHAWMLDVLDSVNFGRASATMLNGRLASALSLVPASLGEMRVVAELVYNRCSMYIIVKSYLLVRTHQPPMLVRVLLVYGPCRLLFSPWVTLLLKI